jgi:hypothetical protein
MIADRGVRTHREGPSVRSSAGVDFPEVVLKHRRSDASLWFYDRGRTEAAFEAASTPGTAPELSGLRGRNYALLVTFRQAPSRRDARARVFPCDPRGKPLGPGVDGVARALPAGAECERAPAALDGN